MTMHRPQPLTYTFLCDSRQAVQILDIRLKELERSLGALRISGISLNDEMTRVDIIRSLIDSSASDSEKLALVARVLEAEPPEVARVAKKLFGAYDGGKVDTQPLFR